jgi:hypothetical protein
MVKTSDPNPDGVFWENGSTASPESPESDASAAAGVLLSLSSSLSHPVTHIIEATRRTAISPNQFLIIEFLSVHGAFCAAMCSIEHETSRWKPFFQHAMKFCFFM